MITVRSTIRIASQASPQIIPVVQGDTGREILFTLADYTIPAGATANYYIQKPSGLAVYNTATIDGNTVLVELTAQSIIEIGDNYGQVRISKNGEVITSFDFILLVKPFRGIEATESTTEMNIFDQAVAEALEQIDNSLDDIVAAEYDSTATYSKGDYCLYDGKLYVCSTAITTAEAWTAAHWTAVTVGEELSDLKADINNVLSSDIKDALLQIAAKVVYVDDDGQDYYNTLHDALYPPANLVSISAVYTQSGTVYDNESLDDLKSDLVVTATYDDSSTSIITSYTLSGTLTEGTSTITVSYGGKTDTFDVTVTHYVEPISYLYYWDLTSSLVDTESGITASTNATQDSSGLHFTDTNQYIDFGAIYASNRTYELDVVNHTQKGHGGIDGYGRLFMCDEDRNTAAGGAGFIYTGNKRGGCAYQFYSGTGWDNTTLSNIPTASNSNDYNDAFFDGKTIKFYISSSNTLTVSYKTIGADDSTYITLGTSNALKTYTAPLLIIGSSGNGDFLYNTTISGLRVREGEV